MIYNWFMKDKKLINFFYIIHLYYINEINENATTVNSTNYTPHPPETLVFFSQSFFLSSGSPQGLYQIFNGGKLKIFYFLSFVCFFNKTFLTLVCFFRCKDSESFPIWPSFSYTSILQSYGFLVLLGAFILESGSSYLVFVSLFPRSKEYLGLTNISFTHLVVRLSHLVLIFLLSHHFVWVLLLSHCLCEYGAWFNNRNCQEIAFSVDSSNCLWRKRKWRSICIYIIFNESRDFIFKKNELISDCFCILFVRRLFR